MLSARAHQLVRDLHTPDLRIYWTDMLLTAAVAWSAFAAAILLKSGSWPMWAALVVSVFAMYRGLCFLHEIAHLRAGVIRRLETTWNFLFGMPLLLPSFMYVGVHQYHHSLATYGTDNDPEYMPFAGKPLMVVTFFLHSVLIPAFLLVRFFLLVPLSWLIPALHQWLCVHFSALSMNTRFRRELTPELSRLIRRRELLTVGLFTLFSGLCFASHIGLHALVIWYTVSALAAALNTLRTLGAHRYTSDGRPLGRDEQLLDSIDTPGRFWTGLWAPVGLRYHALHHYFPGIPYHNLGKAYRALHAGLPGDAFYRLVTSPSLTLSLKVLCLGESDNARAPECSSDQRNSE